MKYLSILIFSILLLSTSCKNEGRQNKNAIDKPAVEQAVKPEKISTQSNPNFDTKQYFKNIKNTDNCLGEKESFDVLGKRLDTVIKAPLDALSTAPEIKSLYYKAIEQKEIDGPPNNGRCADTNEAIKQRCIQKLGTMANQEAATVLIELYKDKKLLFPSGEGRVLTNAMVRCGSVIIPLLEPIKEQRPQVSTAVFQSLKN